MSLVEISFVFTGQELMRSKELKHRSRGAQAQVRVFKEWISFEREGILSKNCDFDTRRQNL